MKAVQASVAAYLQACTGVRTVADRTRVRGEYPLLAVSVREDGTVYALYSFARKVGQSLAAGLSGWLLQRIGYSTAAAQAGQPQPSQVLAGMFNISTLVPFFGFLALSLVLTFWYPLRKAQVEANVAALREKHGDA